MRSGPETLLTNPGLIAKVLVHRAKRTLQKPSALQAAVVHLSLLLLHFICSVRDILLVACVVAVLQASWHVANSAQ